jgi:hypothetical protein
MDNQKTVSDLLNQAAELAFSAAPLAKDKANGPAIEFLAEHLRDIASDEAEAAKPFYFDLPAKLRWWAKMGDRKGLESDDVEKMAQELDATARAIDAGLCFVGSATNRTEPPPMKDIGGEHSYEVDRLLSLAFDVQEVAENLAGNPHTDRLNRAADSLRVVAEWLTPKAETQGKTDESPQV